jgi:hypothetical protein
VAYDQEKLIKAVDLVLEFRRNGMIKKRFRSRTLLIDNLK